MRCDYPCGLEYQKELTAARARIGGLRKIYDGHMELRGQLERRILEVAKERDRARQEAAELRTAMETIQQSATSSGVKQYVHSVLAKYPKEKK